MAIFKKKDSKDKKEEKKTKGSEKPNALEIFDSFKEAYDVGEQWKKDTEAVNAYKYYQTEQQPAGLKLGDAFWVTLNRIRDNQKTKLGILATSPPTFKVTGRGKDSMDRNRLQYWNYLMRWMAKESGLYQAVNHAIFDYLLIEYAALRVRFDKYFQTRMGTLGMTQVERLLPFDVYPDWRSRTASTLDGRFCDYIQRVTKNEFIDRYYNRLVLEKQKSIDIDKIFRDIENKSHFDYLANAGKKGDEKVATVIQHEYWLMKRIEKTIENTNLTLFEKQYRIALAAGDTILNDSESDLSDMNSWTIIMMMGMPMLDSPYPSSDFQAQKEIQDLINVMLSMTINSQARQINSPWMAHEGSLVDEKTWHTSGSEAGVVLTWKYTKEMIAAGITPEVARPRREPPGQMDVNWFMVMDWVKNQFQDISIKDVLRGDNPTGIKSGKHVQLLQAAGMQPAQFTKQSLEDPLARLGQALYTHAKKYLVDEFEIPIDDENAGAEEGIMVNHILTRSEIKNITEQEIVGNIEAVRKEMELVSLRIGDEREGWEEYNRRNKDLFQLMASKEAMIEKNIQLVRRDLTFGNFDVSLTVDPTAELTKLERIERSQLFMELMSRMGATKTALKYGLKIAQEPDIKQIIEDVDKELTEKMQMPGMMSGGQQ